MLNFSLSESLRLEAVQGPNGVNLHLWCGVRSIALDRQTLDAVIDFMHGAPSEESQTHLKALGILRDVNDILGNLPDKLALRTDVSIALDLRKAQSTLPSVGRLEVYPRANIGTTLFIPPYRLGPLQRFHRQILGVWHVLKTRLLSGSIEREDALLTLETAAREMYRADYALQAVFYESDTDDFSLEPMVPLHESEPQYRLSGIHLQRPGLEAIRLPIEGWSEFAPIGTLLGMLGSGLAKEEAGTLPRTTEVVESFVELIATEFVFERSQLTLDPIVGPNAALHLGQNTLLIRMGGQTILMDPWLPRLQPNHSLAPFPPYALAEVDAIIFTRLDRVCLQTLLLLQRKVNVYLPSGDCLVPSHFSDLLGWLGFESVCVLKAGESVTLGPVRLTALNGTSNGKLGVDEPGGAWVLTHEGESVLVLGPHLVDPSGETILSQSNSAEVLKDLNVTTVFMGRWLDHRLEIETGWDVLLRPSSEWLNPIVPKFEVSDFIADLSEKLGPRDIGIIGEGGPWELSFSEPVRTNLGTMLDETSRIFRPSVAYLQARTSAELWVCKPYDQINLSTGEKANIGRLFQTRRKTASEFDETTEGDRID